ncbi:MAG: DUF1552 domain-containing protein [Pirellulaceae bacterium]|nr:DUF1552 domain-containing protein [Pirellulaceae bacterium]
MSTPTSRRVFLKSSTALVALPALESLVRGRAAAAPASTNPPPKRAIFLGFGWGVTESTWYPNIDQPGTNYDLPAGLQPLARHRADFTVVQGLWNKYSNEGHWGSTMWLTGANRYAQTGQSFHNSISADQVAAAQLGQQTRFPSLQLTGSDSAGGSGHGPGLSLAWDVRGKPIGGQSTPVEAFHKLFSSDSTPLEQQQALLAEKRSVLDTVLENAHDLKRGLNSSDNAKLDEYFEGIRDIETRLAKEEQWLGVPRPRPSLAEPKPGLVGREEIRLMYDLIVAALQTDSTRVITYRQPVSTLLTSLEIRVHPHDMSHYHTVLGEKLDASQRRDQAQSELLAGLIDRLKATREADGSRLFDHVALAYGSNIRTGHSLDNCPTLLAGGGAGIKLGHNLVVPKGTPLCNAWLTVLQGLGVSAEKHGDSTGVLKDLVG